MKKIISAWIEQFIEFDSEMEWTVFQHELGKGRKKFKILEETKLQDGKVKIHLMRQYNNNEFPEGGDE